MSMRHKIAVVIGGAALIAGMTACGNTSDEAAEGPVVADLQQQALAAQAKARQAQQDPALRYPPLERAPARSHYQDEDKIDGDHGLRVSRINPVDPNNVLQDGQDAVETALQRIQEIAAQTADISNRPEEARNYFNSVDPLYDAVKDDLDDKTRDGLEKGFKDMRRALDDAGAVIPGGPQPEVADALAAAETASGDIQVVIYHFLQRSFTPNPEDVVDERGVFCTPTSGCGPQEFGDPN